MKVLGSLSFTDSSCPGWLYCPVPLGQDGISGPIPLPWSHQSKLVWAARTKEHLQSQLGISQEKPRYVRLGPYEGAQLVHVCDVICLQSLALAKPEERKEHSGMSTVVNQALISYYLQKVAFELAPPGLSYSSFSTALTLSFVLWL